uniref:Uncharacterized protein n=1 Tax=Meloidogyne hapla TaxID=6305 RepID=A0A1I8BP79_MELHA
MTNNNGSIISNEIDKEATFKEFSAKFISTIAASGSDSSENIGGTRDGWLLIEAIKQFDNDWTKTFFYYVQALELEDPKKLIEKLNGKVHMFRDRENKLRVAVIKTKSNSEVMNLIDSAISRRNSKRHSRYRFAFSDYSYRRLASTYQHHIRLPLFNCNFFYSTNILDRQSPQLERIDDVGLDVGLGQQGGQQGLSQENIGEARDFFVFGEFLSFPWARNFSQFLKLIIPILDTISTATNESDSRKTPPFLDETRLTNCSATKKLRFLPQYFEKIYAANKEWLSRKKKNKRLAPFLILIEGK